MKNIFTSGKLITLLLIFLLSSNAFSQIPANFMAWNYNSGKIHSSALVVDSFVFVGDMNGKFAKLNANTGTEIWSYKAADYIASHAAYKNGIVVFEAGDRLHALNASTGEFIWSFKSSDKTPTNGYDTGWHHSSPVIEGNTAYFGDEWGYMNGVNLITGKLDFQYHIPYEYTTASDYNIRSTPIIQDSIIYFGDYEGVVYAISLKDSSAKWITKMENPRWDGSIVSEMVIDNGVLYCGRYTNALIPIDLKTGTQLWKFSDWDTFLPSTPVFYKDQVIIGTTISSNHIYSLKKETGEKVWELKVKGIFFVRPIIIQDSILVMNSTDPFSDKWGILYFINLEKGEIINEIHLENATESSPAFYNDKILIGGNNCLSAFFYKPAIAEKGTSQFSFDSSEESDTILSNEALDLKYSLVNTSNFCDTITVSFNVEGDESKSNITFTERKGFHIRPSQKLDITLKAKANKLNPGNYNVRILISAARHTNDPMFEKTIHIRVDGTTGCNNPGIPKCSVNPNPFKNRVMFRLESDESPITALSIFSASGKLIYSKNFSDNNNKGYFEWNGTMNNNNPIPPGIYIYQMITNQKKMTGKIIKTE